jgi:hypothetical protein
LSDLRMCLSDLRICGGSPCSTLLVDLSEGRPSSTNRTPALSRPGLILADHATLGNHRDGNCWCIVRPVVASGCQWLKHLQPSARRPSIAASSGGLNLRATQRSARTEGPARCPSRGWPASRRQDGTSTAHAVLCRALRHVRTALARPRETERVHAAPATAHAPQWRDGLRAPSARGPRCAQHFNSGALPPMDPRWVQPRQMPLSTPSRYGRYRVCGCEYCSTPRSSDLPVRRPPSARRPRPWRLNWANEARAE